MNMDPAQQNERRTVHAEKKWLVEQGNQLGELARANKDWKHQLRTIWEAARVEDEPLVVINLLRYQAARNANNWRQPEDVYEALHDLLEQCRTKADQDTELAMDLIRHLLAYTYRAYTFFAAEEEAEDKRTEAQRTEAQRTEAPS